MKKIAYGSSSARMKIRTARDLSKPVCVSTIFFLIFLISFFFLRGGGRLIYRRQPLAQKGESGGDFRALLARQIRNRKQEMDIV